VRDEWRQPGRALLLASARGPETVNRSELGDLGLSNAEEDALVAFLKTLSDGWTNGH
jgi:hypothetical protein